MLQPPNDSASTSPRKRRTARSDREEDRLCDTLYDIFYLTRAPGVRLSIAFLARRLLYLAFTALLVSMIVFGVTQVLPGNAATMILGEYATDEALATLNDRLGLFMFPTTDSTMFQGDSSGDSAFFISVSVFGPLFRCPGANPNSGFSEFAGK